MGVRRQDDVDTLDAPGELAIDIEAVVRKQDDQLRATPAGLVDLRLDVLFAHAERPVRDHPARIRDRRIGKGLTEHRDLDAAALEHGGGVEGSLVPLGVTDVQAKEGKAEARYGL